MHVNHSEAYLSLSLSAVFDFSLLASMEEDRYPGTTFSPPLWRQRRTFILETLRKYSISSVSSVAAVILTIVHS